MIAKISIKMILKILRHKIKNVFVNVLSMNDMNSLDYGYRLLVRYRTLYHNIPLRMRSAIKSAVSIK